MFSVCFSGGHPSGCGAVSQVVLNSISLPAGDVSTSSRAVYVFSAEMAHEVLCPFFNRVVWLALMAVPPPGCRQVCTGVRGCCVDRCDGRGCERAGWTLCRGIDRCRQVGVVHTGMDNADGPPPLPGLPGPPCQPSASCLDPAFPWMAKPGVPLDPQGPLGRADHVAGDPDLLHVGTLGAALAAVSSQ